MKTLKMFLKSTSKFNLIIYFLLAFIITGCSKDDALGTTPTSTPKEVVKSSAKQITSFVFLLTNNPIEVSVVATIDEVNKTITATMPPETDVRGLLPEIKTSDLATVDPDSALDFTDSVTYTVTAEDGSTTTYTVNLDIALTQRQILQLLLDINPEHTINWDLVNTSNLGDLDGVTTDVEGTIIALDLGGRNLSLIPSEIGQLAGLKAFDLRLNNITSVPIEIKDLAQLETLLLSINLLTSLPSEIGALQKLSKLEITANPISQIPTEIVQLGNLKELFLGSNSLAALPAEIGQLTGLTKLGIEGIQFSTFPQEILNLTNLTFLRISNNPLTILPPEIAILENLETLSLNSTQLTTLPPEIGLLFNLTTLELIDNPLLNAIPPEIGFLSNLRSLSFYQFFDISIIPQAVCNLESNGLQIFHSPVPGVDFHTCDTASPMDALISIHTLNPNNTLEWGVNNYPGVTFDANGNLTVITINNRNITALPDDIGQLNTLETLNANSNRIESLPISFGDISTLEVLTLAGNRLGTVPSELGQLTNLALLSLTNNPITDIPQEVCDLQITNGGNLTILTDPGEGCN